jgi:peroxiredoxin
VGVKIESNGSAMKNVTQRNVLSGLVGVAAILLLDPGVHSGAAAQARVGEPAPNFSLADSKGGQLSLGAFRGKTIVLEWSNHGCPYVGKHYRGNNMQALQKKWTAQGVVWLTVISSAPGEQGYVTPEQANQLTIDRGAAPTAVLLDPKGIAGRAYGARVTPHMFIISGNGAVVYAGGIDDKQSARIEDLKTARNFVDEALTEILQGKPVSVPTARAYGCSVKYAS